MAGATTLLTFLNLGNPTGLKFVVEHGDARCLFDFGLEHAPGRAPFSLGLEPRADRELADLIAVGAAPGLEGVYADGEWDGRTHAFISHMHLDHTGLVRFLHPDLPLFFPSGMEEVRRACAATGYMRWRDPPGHHVGDRLVVPVGDIQVRFLEVDHDVPGASGFLITTPDLAIAFSGDQRWHGLHPERNEAFVKGVRGCDVLIQEGVRLGPPPVEPADPARVELGEADVAAGLVRAIGEAEGLVVVNLYGMDRDRVSAVAAACRAAGRRFQMDPVMGPIGGWGDIYTSVEEAAANPRGFCLQMGYEGLPDLIDLRPPTGSVYIHSNGQPGGAYDPTWPVMLAWVETFKLEMKYLGCSGHSRQGDIERQVREIGPGMVLPVHSRNPEALQVEGVPTLVAEVGRAYSSQELRLARNL